MSALEYLPTIIKVAEQTRHRPLIALSRLLLDFYDSL
jgi:hypothetical protein